MNNIKLSILITTYNLEKYIDFTLKNVFEQYIPFNYEVLIGDDGSTDETLNIIKKWINKYPNIIRLYEMPRNHNKKYIPSFRMSRNRLNLIENSRGEYFICLDGDDFYIDDHKLYKQVMIMDRPENEDCIICSHRMKIYYESNDLYEEMNPNINKSFKCDFKYYWSHFYFHLNANLCRNIFLYNKYDQKFMNFFDDNMQTFYMLNSGKVFFLNEDMRAYRVTERGFNTESECYRNLVELIIYDSTLKMNKKMRFSSYIRFLKPFYYTLKKTKEINQESNERIKKWIFESNSSTAIKAINYREMSLINKMGFKFSLILKIFIGLLLKKLHFYKGIKYYEVYK